MRRRSLRLRLLVTFGLGAFVLSSLFASLTYLGVKRLLISNQQQTDLKQSYVNADLVRSTLYTSPTQLSNLLTYMDGKSGAEDLITKVLNDPALLQTLAAAPNPTAAAPNGEE